MNEISNLGKTLIFIGGLLALFGLILTLAGKVHWIGRLPGDVYVQKKNFSFYFPLTTGILISAVITLILWLLNRK
jgi:hypothetical protein